MATVKLPDDFVNRLDSAAAEQGKSVPQLIQDAIDAYIAREEAKAKGEAPPVQGEAE